MTKPVFGKLSREVGLVLISSSLFLAGCRRIPEEEPKDENGNPVHQSSSGWHGGWHWGGYGYSMGRTGAGLSGTSSGAAGSSGATASSGSARGGFGATGHAVSAGG